MLEIDQIRFFALGFSTGTVFFTLAVIFILRK